MLLFALGAMTLVCGLLVFLLAGDQIVDLGRTTLLQIRLSMRQNDLDTPIGINPTDIRFTVQSGDTPRLIAENLQTAGLIADKDLFVDYVQAEDLDVELEAGKYLLNQTMNIREIALALTDSRFSQITFSIIPGQRIEEVLINVDANRLFDFNGDDFLAVVGRGAPVDTEFAQQVGLPPGASLEGFLYPDTYLLDLDVTAAELRDRLLQAFTENVILTYRQAAESQGFTLYEVVTLASIVQREAVHDDEKPLIAGVYLNRLEIGMRLEADPTVQYGLGSSESWWPRITVDDYLGAVSLYNTYINNGLPPGPIANPGLPSITAVINPQPSDFFFFRGDCRTDGYHTFSTTFDEHRANGC